MTQKDILSATNSVVVPSEPRRSDDIILISNDVPMLTSVKEWLGSHFQMNDLGDAQRILGSGITLSKSQSPTEPMDIERMKSIPYASTVGSIIVGRCGFYKAEYIVASEASKEAVWIRQFLKGLSVVPTAVDPITIYCDNSGAIFQAKEPKSSNKFRHVPRKYHVKHDSYVVSIVLRRMPELLFPMTLVFALGHTVKGGQWASTGSL
ncbi:uncharacterized protein LOC141601315 [Silene latifolia]|uniref:uncharacterized protein LOC141601315 n=1 Tax=Silene latifolia TaxID=37657 RepID=UPI003D76B3CF